ncbi:unnamed protein product [Symbiodinium sp. CCMP2456]|nr:unnamed protein product [Symbiodinium sp. CCMP2456]
MACQSYRKDALCGASPRKPWRYLVRFVGRRLKQCKSGKTSVSRNRVNRFRRAAGLPLKAVAETFEPPPLSCGDYTLHLRMAESSIGLEELHSQLRNKAGQQVAYLTGVYIYRGGDDSFLQSCGCDSAPEALRSLAPILFNEFGRPLDALKQRCGVRARTAGFLWLSSVQAPNLDPSMKREFAQKVFECLGGAMKRLSLVVCPFQEDLADFGFQSAEMSGVHLCLWEKSKDGVPAVPDASMVPQALPADVGDVIAFEADETSCDSNDLNVSKPVPLQEQGAKIKLSVEPEDVPEVPADGPLKGQQACAPKAEQVPVPVFVKIEAKTARSHGTESGSTGAQKRKPTTPTPPGNGKSPGSGQKRKLSMTPPPLPDARRSFNVPEVPQSLSLPFGGFAEKVGPSWWTPRVQLALTYAAGFGAALLMLQADQFENGRPGKVFWGSKHLPNRIQEQGAHKSFLRGMAELARIIHAVNRDAEPPIASLIMQVVSPLSSVRRKFGIEEQHRHSLSHFFGKGGQVEQVLSAIVDEAEAFCASVTEAEDSTDTASGKLSQSDWASCYRALPQVEADRHNLVSFRERLCGTSARK